MRTLRLGAAFGSLATPALMGILSLTTGLDAAGWVVGLATGWTATALIAVARARSERPEILPADWITLTRALLAAGVAALVAASADRPAAVTVMVTLAAIALALDAVDGPVARRTGTATPLGARFDGEVDAALILVLSVDVSRSYGGWVLAIGAARYAFLVSGWAVRWLAAPLPPRYWRKVVTAFTGIALTVAGSGLLPGLVDVIAVGIALLLVAESYGRDVVWLYQNCASERTHVVFRRITALVAVAIVWATLVAPDRPDRLTPTAFARIPIEGIAVVAVGLLLPRRSRRVVAAVVGAMFGLLAIVKILDMGFYFELGRPFNPILDWSNIAPAVGVVRDSIGAKATDVVLGLAVVAMILLIVLVAAATVRVTTVTARHRRGTVRGLTLLATIWALSAGLSLQLLPGVPVASTSTAGLAVSQVRDAVAAINDQHRFQAAISGTDPYARIRPSDLLTGLRGKDVVVAFVESYGQVAVQGTSFSPGVDSVLRNGTTALTRAGFSARSAFLDSPTFGGLSWLAHSTLQSGLWVDSQQRFDQLMHSRRLTLSSAFNKAGWRTVSDNPADWRQWPLGTSFYRYDKLYGTGDVGYQGPTFSWAKVPDQYTLAMFQRHELYPGHRPVMAEIDLVSSHTPWTPLPRMVPWRQLGDGSIYNSMPAQGLTPTAAWRDAGTVRRLYGQSVQYSLQALVSWIARVHDKNLVLVLLGDHQPSSTVSGYGADHQVPISFVTHDQAVLSRIAPWDWQDGLLPGRTAPVWSMSAFRNRFLDAFDGGSPPVRTRLSTVTGLH